MTIGMCNTEKFETLYNTYYVVVLDSVVTLVRQQYTSSM